ncbi:expressed unknown protein [Seminavis robusta]|uniref:Uncharacterized protein n=1 Tax=Seminavis robusta TaxID=568900 RepID=A0A9N8DEI6_9STRA|nr:expressed unknown protein [Seminavis robusta]|eukprot:Sro102_g052240.1 n/a (256) ;mRNA; f:110635-111402
MCFEVSGQKSEGLSCYSETCGRLAWYILSAPLIVNECTDVEVIKSTDQKIWVDMMHWTNCMAALTKDYICEMQKLPKPNWWCHNGMLKRTTKVALYFLKKFQADDKETINRMSFIRACALSGFISKGKCCGEISLVELVQRVSVECTTEEMKEASSLFKVVQSEKGEDHAKEAGFFAELITRVEEQVRNSGDSVIPARGISEAGLWVVIHGLVSPPGLAMNNKIGLVCMDGLEDGRVAVKVDGILSPKRIKPRNL